MNYSLLSEQFDLILIRIHLTFNQPSKLELDYALILHVQSLKGKKYQHEFETKIKYLID